MSFWLRPGTVTATLALILSVVMLLVQMRVPTVSAAELLNRCAASERALLDSPGTVLHRALALEERESSSGSLIRLRKIEIWQSNSPIKGVIKARLMYDEAGRLVAGEWTKSDGSQTVYDRGSVHVEAAGSSSAIPQPLPETIWRLEPSANSFSAVVGQRITTATVEEQAGDYLINYESEGEAGLLKATLRLRKTDHRAIEQTLLIKHEASTVEYRFVESGLERRPASAVAPQVFDTEFLSPTPVVSLLNLIPQDAGASSPAPEQYLVAASAELEMDVAYLLNAAKANLDEQVNLTRTLNGKLLVQGIVETGERKKEILQALSPVMGNPAVVVEISTVAEAMRRQKESASVEAQQVEIDGNIFIPAYQDLVRYFSARGVTGERVEDQVRAFSSRMLTLSRRALRHAWALRRIANQLSPEAVRALSPEAKIKRQSIIRGHALAFNHATGQLRIELQTVFFEAAESSMVAGEPEINSEEDLTRAISRLVELHSTNDAAIRSAFTISAGAAQTPAIKTPQFWLSLRRCENLGAMIKAREARQD